MPFVKGQKRPPGAGRKRGSIPKLSKEVSSRLEALGCDPIEGMAKIALNKRVNMSIRAAMYRELAKYVAPQLRATEHRLVDGEGADAALKVLVEYIDKPSPSADAQA